MRAPSDGLSRFSGWNGRRACSSADQNGLPGKGERPSVPVAPRDGSLQDTFQGRLEVASSAVWEVLGSFLLPGPRIEPAGLGCHEAVS